MIYTPESQLPIALNVSLPLGLLLGHPRSLPQVPASSCPQRKPSPWTLPQVRADVIGLVLMSSHNTEHPRPMHWPLKESGPKVTSTMVQSRLILWLSPRACQQYKARAAPPDGSLRQS